MSTKTVTLQAVPEEPSWQVIEHDSASNIGKTWCARTSQKRGLCVLCARSSGRVMSWLRPSPYKSRNSTALTGRLLHARVVHVICRGFSCTATSNHALNTTPSTAYFPALENSTTDCCPGHSIFADHDHEHLHARHSEAPARNQEQSLAAPAIASARPARARGSSAGKPAISHRRFRRARARPRHAHCAYPRKNPALFHTADALAQRRFWHRPVGDISCSSYIEEALT